LVEYFRKGGVVAGFGLSRRLVKDIYLAPETILVTWARGGLGKELISVHSLKDSRDQRERTAGAEEGVTEKSGWEQGSGSLGKFSEEGSSGLGEFYMGETRGGA